MQQPLNVIRKQIDGFASPMTVLIIDDDPCDRMALKKMISKSRLPRCRPVSSKDVETAIREGVLATADLILLDDHLSTTARAEDSLKSIRSAGTQCPVIVISGTRKHGRDIASLRLGAVQFVDKNTLGAPAMQRLLAFGACCKKHSVNLYS